MVGSGLVGRGGDDFDGGWDNRVTLVDGRWVDRSPRSPDREPQLRREAALLPWLAPLLPLPVPVPVVVGEDPLTVRHAYLPGGPCAGTSPAQGTAVGSFLASLHGLDPGEAVRHGAQSAESSHRAQTAMLEQAERDVLPLLPKDLRGAGEALLARLAPTPTAPRLAHGDLGPEHIRAEGDAVSGIIDWGDCRVADPAIDLAWTVFGAGRPFADAVLSAYGADEALVGRGRDFHLLGPWHEVLYGLESGGPAYVESGLAGSVERLERLGRA